MKKKLVFVIAICLVLALTFTLFACGDKDKGNGSGTNTQTQTGDNQGTGNGGNDSGTNQGGTTPGGNGGNGGSTTPSGNEGGQGGTQDATVFTKTMATRESIMTSIGDTYKVVAQSPDGQAVTTVASDGTYFYANDPYESFNKKLYDNTYLYPYTSIREGKYHKMGTPTFTADGSAPTMLGRGNVGNILQFAGETLSYNTEEAVTFLGRSAKKYTLEGQNLYGYDVLFHLEVTIDDLTGACLKCDWYGRAGAGFTGSTFNKAAFEVTEFEYGDDNRATRVFIASIVNKIDVYEWDTEFLEQAGLSGVDAPDGDLFYSEWCYDSTRDADNAEWEAQYKLYSTTADEKLAEVNALMQAFYNAGASLNYDQEQTEYSELSWDDGDGSVGFTGYTQDYQFCLYCDYISSAANPYWRITVNVVLVDRD